MKKKVVIAMLLLLMLTLFGACGSSDKKLEWPESGICTVLPKPESNNGEVETNYENAFGASISGSADDYAKYVAKCQKHGFTIDREDSSYSYAAYNEEGYKLDLYYNEIGKKFHISLDAPKTMSTIVWPTTGMGSLIPQPKSNYGNIGVDSSIQFYASISNTTVEDFNAYIEECIKIGFNADSQRSDKVYHAYNADGDSLHLQYEGFSTMSISMYAASSDSSEESKAEVSESVEPEDSGDSSSVVEESSESAPEDQILTVDNCPELSSLLQTDPQPSEAEAIFSKYMGRTIEFDANIAYMVKEGYLYGFLIYAGDYSETETSGPPFKIENAGISDLGIPEPYTSSFVRTGSNVRVVAVIREYRESTGIFLLEPVSIEPRGEAAIAEAEESNNSEDDFEMLDADQVITADNCPEWASILEFGDPSTLSEREEAFASRYAGRTVEFDGYIIYVSNHGDYKTRYDIVIGVGDYNEDYDATEILSGKLFTFEDVGARELVNDLFLPSYVRPGNNIRMTAVIDEYQYSSGLKLEPVLLESR